MDALHDKTWKEPALVETTMELTYGCNLNCVHCFNPTHKAKNELSNTQVKNLLDQLAKEGCFWIGFTGGELFSRPDTMDILSYAKKLGMIVNIITNATLITEEIARLLSEMNVYMIEVSVYGASDTVYEKVTRTQGSFRKFLRGLDFLTAYQLPVKLNMVLMSLNYHERKAMIRLAEDRKLRYVTCSEIRPKANRSKEPLKYRLSQEQEFEIWKEQVGEEAKCSGDFRFNPAEIEEILARQDKIFNCKCGKGAAALNPYGKMNLCVSMAFPELDLATLSVHGAWKALQKSVSEIQPGKEYECAECKISEYCNRSASDSWLETGVFDSPCMEEFRKQAEKKVEYLGLQSS